MNESHITGYIGSIMQFIVAAYALRLNRRFGTARVGWSLFGAFSLLALLQLVQSMGFFDASLNSAIKVNVTYVLISFLLLIGMAHLETMLKERLRMERMEKQLRAGLESEVKAKTAHLTRAIEELMQEMEQTKRMAAIIESTGDTVFTQKLDHPEPIAREQMVMSARAGCDDEDELILAGLLDGEWAAHF